MFERGLSKDEVLNVIEHGASITEYPDDRPYPSRLLLGWIEERPIHVVVAKDWESRICFVVTAYPPNPSIWSADFKTRRT
ncbi:MAG: DUF4258 domain-containing protein [Methylothermaceae bacterium]|nr:DUF4258 domain-containing protein [Methylothermaceae bacterium]